MPKEFVNLINLQELYLDKNKIKEIPKEFVKLVNSQEVYLDDNLANVIPEKLKLKNSN